MLNAKQPLQFALRKIAAGDNEFGGMPPFMAAMPPQVWQWLWADNTLYGITDTDIKGLGMPQPLIFNPNGLKLSARGLFHPAVARLPASGDTLYGITDANIDQPTMPKPIVFTMQGNRRVFHPLPVQPQIPDPSMFLTIQGTTKDKTGAAVIGFTLYLFDITSGTPVFVAMTTSDGAGLYSFTVVSGKVYWITDYRTGIPDMGGVTLNTLTGGAHADIFAYDPTTIPDVTPIGALLTNISTSNQEILISATMTASV